MTDNFTLQYIASGNATAPYHFMGSVDDVIIYGSALNGAQIQELYERGITFSDSGLSGAAPYCYRVYP